jgi:sialic acid synthase SpsE
MNTFVIAEAGINHGGDLKKAKALIRAAKEVNASAIKFQTYKTELRVPSDNPAFDILKQCETSFDEQRQMKEYADEIGIEFFSTPFDIASAKFLVNDLGLNKLKLASFDCSNTKYLEQIAALDVEVILSVGLSNSDEISKAVSILNPDKLTLLHCVSAYPCPPENVNLLRILTLAATFHTVKAFGYSDHTTSTIIPASAALLGAAVIEKHFTLDRNDGSVDNPVSIDPPQFKEMIQFIKLFETVAGSGSISSQEIEESCKIFKRKS